MDLARQPESTGGNPASADPGLLVSFPGAPATATVTFARAALALARPARSLHFSLAPGPRSREPIEKWRASAINP